MENLRQQYVLRVKRNSELDTLLQYAEENTHPITAQAVAEITGKKSVHWLAKQVANQCDNLSVQIQRGEEDQPLDIDYTQTVGVSAYVQNTTPTESAAPMLDEPQDLEQRLVFTDAPPGIEPMENFVTPQWQDTMRKMVLKGKHVALSSMPGTGKDTSVLQLAAEQSKIMVTLGADSGLRKRDLVGSVQIANGQSFFQVAEPAMAMVQGWWLLISEVNSADPDALMLLNSVLAPPNVINIGGRMYPVHPDFRLFITYNPGLVGTKPLPPSFKDRFFSIKIKPLSPQRMASILKANGAEDMDPFELEQVVLFGKVMTDAQDRGALRYQITTRRLMDACILLELGESLQDALSDAVIGAIDSPIEAKTAHGVLREIMDNLEYAKRKWDAEHPVEPTPIDEYVPPSTSKNEVPF